VSTPTRHELEARIKAGQRALGRLEAFTGALERHAGEQSGDAEMRARGRARELRGLERQRRNH